MMKRKVYDRLCEWKKRRNGKSALLIEGARRVGKSYVVEEFAKAEYKAYLLIDWSNVADEVKDIFNNYLYDIEVFFRYLLAFYNINLPERESLIIFDEVQAFPRARAAIKYLVADGRYDYIETGSLISIKKNVKDIVIPSEEHHMKMYPMDFEEFLWAMGNDTLMPIISEHCAELKPLPQALHRKAMDYFRLYMIIGGMPQAVKEYQNTADFSQTDTTKRDILTLYRDDISKYTNGYEKKVSDIFEEIPAQLQKSNKKFKLSAISENARYREYHDALFWLSDAMIINTCYNTTEPNIGLRMRMDRFLMKCYMADTGLLISHAFDEKGIASEEIYRKLLFDKLEVNKGMLVENIVAQMLTASGHKLYFYENTASSDKNSRMEIDFLLAKSKVSSRHNISPIEVKSGKNYTLTSLNKFMVKYHEQLHTPYVLHSGNLKQESGIVFLPLYMASLL